MIASFLRNIGGGASGLVGMATVLPLDLTPYDAVSRDTKTARAFELRPPDNETGRDRLYMMFSTE